MKIDRIKYGRSFQIGMAQWEKIDIEAEVQDGEDIQLRYVQLNDEVAKIHKRLNPSLYPTGEEELITSFPPEVRYNVRPQKKSITESIIEQIHKCTDIKQLETFRFLSSRNDEIKHEYDEKYLSLTNG